MINKEALANTLRAHMIHLLNREGDAAHSDDARVEHYWHGRVTEAKSIIDTIEQHSDFGYRWKESAGRFLEWREVYDRWT